MTDTIERDTLQLIRTAWPFLAGASVAERSQPIGVKGETLIVATASSRWSKRVEYIEQQVVDRLRLMPEAVGLIRLRCRSGASFEPIRPEREIEDAIAAAPWVIYPEFEANGWAETDLRVARQVYLDDAGTADLLIVHPHGLSIVEVKADSITDTAVGQAMRYACAVANGLNRWIVDEDTLRTIGCYRSFAIDIRVVALNIGWSVRWVTHADELRNEIRRKKLVASGVGITLLEWRNGRGVPVEGYHGTRLSPAIAGICKQIAATGLELWPALPRGPVDVSQIYRMFEDGEYED